MKTCRYSFIINRVGFGLYFVTPVLLYPFRINLHTRNLCLPGLCFQEGTYLETSMLTLRVVACVIPQAWGLKKLPPSPLARLMTAVQKGSKAISSFSFIREVAEPAFLSAERTANVSSLPSFIPWSMKLLAEKTVMHSKKRSTKLLLLMETADGKLFPFVAWAVDTSLHGFTKVRVVAPLPSPANL